MPLLSRAHFWLMGYHSLDPAHITGVTSPQLQHRNDNTRGARQHMMQQQLQQQQQLRGLQQQQQQQQQQMMMQSQMQQRIRMGSNSPTSTMGGGHHRNPPSLQGPMQRGGMGHMGAPQSKHYPPPPAQSSAISSSNHRMNGSQWNNQPGKKCGDRSVLITLSCYFLSF